MKCRFFTAASPFLWQTVSLAAFLGLAGASGCGERAGNPVEQKVTESRERADAEAAAPSGSTSGGEGAALGSAVTVTDRLGRSVSFTEPPQRIVSLSPSLTEIVFAIGAGDRIVGATKHCDYPPAAQSIPRIGGGTLESLNQELIVALEPDLVLCKADTHEPLLRNLERLGIPLLALGPETVAELYDHTKLLGQVTRNASRADQVIEAMQKRIEAVTARVPAGDGPVVFYQVWDDPLMTVGPGSYIGELLRLAGSRSLFEATEIRYPKVSAEVVIAGNPDVIIAPATHATPVTVEGILSRPGWSQVRAIQNGRVYVIDRDHISRCGPRIVDALEEIAAVLYPDRFPPRPEDANSSGAAESKESKESKDRAP